MSQAEFERFVATLKSKPELAESYASASDPAELAERLRADGYDISEADIAGKLAETPAEVLSDGDLDRVAGGSRVRSMREIMRWVS